MTSNSGESGKDKMLWLSAQACDDRKLAESTKINISKRYVASDSEQNQKLPFVASKILFPVDNCSSSE